MPDESRPATAPLASLVIVRAAVAPMHAEARVGSPQVSQALAGHALLVHEEAAGDWLRAAGLDGYAAWVHRGYVTPPDAARHAALRAAVGPLRAPWLPDGTVGLRRAAHDAAAAVSLGCRVRDGAGGRALPLGALVLPGAGSVEDGEAVPLDERAARFPATGEAVAASAARLFAGASYQWGGVTPWGADCSGFAQAVFRLHGVELPRDAWQQALAGAPAPDAVDALAPGDLLFFSDRDDRRVTHVGVALGGARMAHVALGRGGFAVERLDDEADPYVARLLAQRVTARRLVG